MKKTSFEKVTAVLPNDLVDTMRELAPLQNDSEFIADALRHFIEERRKEILYAELIAGYQATADEAVAISEAWLLLGQEAWERHANATE